MAHGCVLPDRLEGKPTQSLAGRRQSIVPYALRDPRTRTLPAAPLSMVHGGFGTDTLTQYTDLPNGLSSSNDVAVPLLRTFDSLNNAVAPPAPMQPLPFTPLHAPSRPRATVAPHAPCLQTRPPATPRCC